MAEQVEFGIEIDVDDGGVTELVNALKGLDGTVKLVAGASKKLERNTGGVKRAQSQTKRTTDQLKGSFDSMGSSLKGLQLTEAFRAGVGAVKQLFATLKAVGGAIIGTIANAQRAERAFKFLAGPEEGDKLLKFIDELGGQTELTKNELRGLGFELLSAGFKGRDFVTAMAAGLDIAAGSKDKLTGLNSALVAFKQLAISAKLELDAFKSAGIPIQQFFTNLARETGLGVEAAKKQFNEGKTAISTSLKVFADLAARGLGGGAFGLKAGAGLEARITQLKDLPNVLIESLSKTDAAGRLTDFLGSIVKEIGPGSDFATSLEKMFADAFSEGVTALKDLTKSAVDFIKEIKPSDIKAMVAALKGMAAIALFLTKAFVGVFTLFGSIGTALGEAAGAVLVFVDDVIGTFMKLFQIPRIVGEFMGEALFAFVTASRKFLSSFGVLGSVVKALITLFGSIGTALGEAAGAVFAAATDIENTITDFVDDVISTFMKLFQIPRIVGEFMGEALFAFVTASGEFLTSLLDQGIKIGGSLIDGFVGGVKAKINAAVDAVKGVGSAVVGGLKNILGISSPSKVFMDFGRQTAFGFAAGIEAEAKGIEAKVRTTFTPPSLPLPTIGGVVSAATSGAISIGDVNTTVVVDKPGATADEIAEAASRSIVAEIQSMLERTNSEAPA